MRLVYMDEAGYSGRNLDDPQQPIHIVGAVVIKDSDWLDIEGKVDEIIDDYILNLKDRESFEFHTSDLYQGRGYFDKWDWKTRMEILTRLVRVIVDGNLPVIYGAVNKQKLKAQYRYPADPHDLAFLLCAERIEGWFASNAPSETGMFIADETKAKYEMKTSLRQYRRTGIPLGYKGTKLNHIIETIHFADSKECFGIQLADCCNYFIKREAKAKPSHGTSTT